MMVWLEIFNKTREFYKSKVKTKSAWCGGFKMSRHDSKFGFSTWSDRYIKLGDILYDSKVSLIVCKTYPMFTLVREDYKFIFKYLHRENKKIIIVKFINPDWNINKNLLPKSLVARNQILKLWQNQNRQSKDISLKDISINSLEKSLT